MKRYKLGEIAYFVEEKISSDELTLNEYITTDCLLQNKKGRTIATNPKSCSLTKFKKGDVLIGNIRPYLKKYGLQKVLVVVLLMYWFCGQKKWKKPHFYILYYYRMIFLIL